MVLTPGFAPGTPCSSGRRSTTELHKQKVYLIVRVHPLYVVPSARIEQAFSGSKPLFLPLEDNGLYGSQDRICTDVPCFAGKYMKLALLLGYMVEAKGIEPFQSPCKRISPALEHEPPHRY